MRRRLISVSVRRGSWRQRVVVMSVSVVIRVGRECMMDVGGYLVCEFSYYVQRVWQLWNIGSLRVIVVGYLGYNDRVVREVVILMVLEMGVVVVSVSVCFCRKIRWMFIRQSVISGVVVQVIKVVVCRFLLQSLGLVMKCVIGLRSVQKSVMSVRIRIEIVCRE